MLQIAICDDEAVFCRLLADKVKQILTAMQEPFTLQTYTETAGFQKANQSFDIIFLDIEMPVQNGLQFAKALRLQGDESAIVFISAFSAYVFDVFSLHAEDFLCKPIDDTKLYAVLERVIAKKKTEDKKCLCIQTSQWCKSIKLQSICYCEVINRIIYVHTTKEVLQYYGKIADLGKQLDERFYQCHRSYFVNLDFVVTYKNGEIVLEDGTHIPVSRLRQKAFMGYMLSHMKRGE